MQRSFKISLSQEYYSEKVCLSQYDSDYAVNFEVLDKGTKAPINGMTAYFEGTRCDGLSFRYSGTASDNFISFTIDTALTAVPGRHTGEIVLYDGSGLWFGSANVQILVEKAARPDTAVDADVTSQQTLLEQITELAEQTEQAAEGVMDMTVSAQTLSQGAEATVTKTVTEGQVNLEFGLPQGATGATGATPNLTIGTVTTLEPDASATATITGTAEDPVLNLGLPKGQTGEVTEEEFTQLKEDLTNIDNWVYNYSEMGASAVAANYKLTDAGISAYDVNYKILKFEVSAGDVVKVVSDDRFQFQTQANVPASGTGNRIGITYGTGTYTVTAPESAKYLIVSTFATGSNAVVYSTSKSVAVEHKELIINKRDLSVGNLQASTFTIGEYPNNVIYYHKIPVKGGSVVRIESSDITGAVEKHFRFAQYRASDGSYKSTISDTTNNTYQIDSDCGYFAFSMYCKNSNSAIIANLFTVLSDDFTFTVVYVGDNKDTYTDSDDVNTLIDRAITLEDITHGLHDKLLQAKRPINLSSDAYKSAVQPVVILHFSDVHGDAVELYRILEIKKMYADLIDDMICTGDIVQNRWSDGIEYWSNTEGAEDVLIAIGNHDTLTDPSGYDWTQVATQSEQYDRYIAPFVSNWGCTYESGKTYYYKDYTAKKLRMIVLNCMLTGTDNTDQLSWFEIALAGAKTSGYSVVVADHMMIASAEKIDCNFSTLDKSVSGTGNVLSIDYASKVQDFINAGGKFVCYIAGHTHWDMIVKGTTDYTDQLCITIDALSRTQGNQYSDTQRTDNTKSQDLANLIVFDTASEVIKIIRIGANMDHYLRAKNCITINYGTGTIISQN